MTILVTGATGFVGSALVARLSAEHRPIRATSRTPPTSSPNGVSWVRISAADESTDWTSAVDGVSTVMHLAARVHVMREKDADPFAAFRRTNVGGTLSLARQAAAAGVSRLVYVSSIKVHGEAGVFRETDQPNPFDPYGQSKLEAELGLRQVAADTGLSVVIVRPPLIYGPGVRANFRALIRVVARGIPLPVGAVHNRRSLVGLDNFVDFLIACADRPSAHNETFLVSDGMDLSTPDLVRALAAALGRPARILPIPLSLLRLGAAALGRRDVAQRLLGSLQVDISKARTVLGWSPPLTVEQGLRRAVASGND